MGGWGWGVCVCVCVCVRTRGRQTARLTEATVHKLWMTRVAGWRILVLGRGAKQQQQQQQQRTLALPGMRTHFWIPLWGRKLLRNFRLLTERGGPHGGGTAAGT